MPREANNKLNDKSNDIERKLIESEERFHNLINNLSDIILEGNSKSIVTYVSPQCYNIMGYHPAEIIGKSALNFIHPEDVAIIAEVIISGIKTKKSISVPRYRLMHKNGNVIFVSARGNYVDSNGNGRFIVTIRDITARVGIEQKLKESATKYKLISENANDLILIVSESLNIEYVNKDPLLKLSGYSVEEILGKRASDFIHFDDAKNALIQISEEFNKEGRGTIEARMVHKNGHSVNVEINGSLFHNDKGEPKALLITRDITERKNAEKLILEENKKLLELSQIKSELITTTSHELKTPLNSIFAASQFLLSNLKDQIGEDALKFVEMVYRGGQKLKILIENLLDISKIESEKLSLHLHEENIVEVTNSSINDIKYWANERNINIKVDHPKELNVLVDRIKIEQVITNLLSNAIKYTPPKGEIHVHVYEEELWVNISIKDNGIGLLKKEIKNLFKKFGKIERFGKDLDVESDGTGLGLFISKEIIELHSGEILVESKGRNKGSTFIIRLPKLP